MCTLYDKRIAIKTKVSYTPNHLQIIQTKVLVEQVSESRFAKYLIQQKKASVK